MTYAINPNAKNVWIRDNEDTMDLSPITDASSVYLENGRTLEQELSEGSMVSNVATVNKSMSKVIGGTLDGVYESGVMYGRSLVNNNNNKFKEIAFNATNTTQATNYALLLDDRAGCPDLNVTMVVGKKYLILEKWTISSTTGNGHTIQPKIIDKNGDVVYFSGDGQVKGTGTFTLKRTFIPTVDVDKFYFAITNGAGVTVSGTFHYGMIIEYQEGMENWDIPYFEGMCDVKMPILRNVGKNLFDMSMVETNSRTHSQWNTVISENSIRSTRWGDTTNGEFGAFIRIDNVKPSTTYTLTYEPYINNVYSNVYAYIYNNSTIWGESLTAGGNGTIKFTTKSNTEYITIGLNYGICSLNTVYETRNIQLEESPTSTTYEPHKSNILHTPEIVTLRSLPNGVRDELNLKTGEYIKRIGEVVLDGSEDESYSELSVNENSYTVWTHFPIPAKAFGKTINNKCFINEWWEKESSSCGIDHNGSLIVTIKKELLSTTSTEALKKYLKQNPITIQYELQTPITTKVALTQSEPIVKIGTELPNGVCDTYNLLTGEHIQRVGKVVLDGSEVWTKVAFPSTNTTHCYSSLKIENLKMPNINEKNIVSDRFQTVAQESYNYSNEEMYTWRTGELLYVNILRSRLSTSDVQGLKAWFKENPTTVWYELKNPIVTKKNGLPNTHGVTLPSGEVDKYNESTGVYTQNLGKVVLDGSQDEEWAIVSSLSLTNTIAFQCMLSQGSSSRADNLICNSFTPQEGSSDVEHIRSAWAEDGAYKAIALFINKTKLPTQDVSGLRSYLASNNIELYYSLPASKTIDIPLINVGQVLPNGVCDTYNPITKEYVKRVSGTVLVGNEDWSLMNSPYETDCIGFVTPCSLANWTQSQANLNIVCEGYVGNYELWNVDEEGFSVFKTPTRLAIKVKRSKLSTADINGFKKFLKLNPLAVWYELATPEVSTVDLDLSTLYSSSPIAYENGHIILESGHNGQSLLPTLEYSTITNRVKQIESIGEQVLRQEKQLTMLEQMLIQGIIGMDYNNILLTLNLEIDEVM